MAVSAVIPHQNSGDLLDRCLDALAACHSVDEVVVADEGSTDGSVERAARRTRVRVVESPGRGFAVAMNAGIAVAAGEWLLLMNSDAFVRPDTVERLRRRLEEEPRLALCGAALLEPSGAPSKSHTYLFTLRRAFIDALNIRPTVPSTGEGLQFVEAVFPTCALARRSAIEAVGGFDERFLFYYEDMDLCRRLHDAGWQQAVDWDAAAVHVSGGSTSVRQRQRWFRQYHESRLVYLRKHYPRGWLAYLAVWAPKAFAHAFAWRARAVARHLRRDRAGESVAREWASSFAASAVPLRRPVTG
jgi:GT2 family glycosyltransferase